MNIIIISKIFKRFILIYFKLIQILLGIIEYFVNSFLKILYLQLNLEKGCDISNKISLDRYQEILIVLGIKGYIYSRCDNINLKLKR